MKTKTKLKLTPRLPDKIHLLIDVALNDLNKVRRSNRYEVDMTDWHSGGSANGITCTVCFAGAVMAKTFEMDYTKPADPTDVSALLEDRLKLYALDHLRLGNIGDALDLLKVRRPKGLPAQIDITDYGDDPRLFLRDMRELQALLLQFDL